MGLRTGVKFSDGTDFDAQDVVATYRALRDPAYASSLTSDYAMISDVVALDANTVRFDLSHPYAPFPHKLVLGIVPSEKLAQPGPLEANPLNTEPVGTGPYRLAEWRRGERLVLEANPDYFGGAPAVTKVTVVFATDDNTRAQRMSGGEFDATVLPPTLAATFADTDDVTVITHHSADYRTIALPTHHPVTGDAAVRLALNHAVNRQGMIDAYLGGKGVPAYTPIPPVLPEFVEPAATFSYDREQAERILDQAGWVKGADGVRARDGVPARFTLMYAAGDAVRKDLATAFASDARAVGIEVSLEGLGWEAIDPRLGQDAVVLAGGRPFDPDLTAYPLLHSSYAANGYNNPGSYANPEVDAALDAGRHTTDPGQRAVAYKQFQRAYTADPGMVFLAFLDHTYVLRDRWQGYQEVVDPHTHGLTWGPWWNLPSWTPIS